MSKVAICIPCYNGREKLKRLLHSITMQDFRDFTVIITDDSDHDQVRDLAAEYSEINLQYCKNSVRLGVARNTNKALRLANEMNAEYVKIMYHDDWFSSGDSLGKMVQALEDNRDAGIAFSNTYESGENVNYERRISEEQVRQLRDSRFTLAYANIIGAPSATVMRMHDLRMDESLAWFVDVEWYIRILGKCKKFVFIDEPLISIGISETQLTSECMNNPALILEESIYLYGKYRELRCENYMDAMTEYAKRVISQCHVYQMYMQGTRIYIYGAGEMGKECAEFLERNGIAYEAFIVSDGKGHAAALHGRDVMEFSQYLGNNRKEKDGFILALNERHLKEVIGDIQRENVHYVVWR